MCSLQPDLVKTKMGRKQLILETLMNRGNHDASSEDSSQNEDSDSDFSEEDVELQRAFANGELKPGLHGMVAFKRTESEINDEEGKHFAVINNFNCIFAFVLRFKKKTARSSIVQRQLVGTIGHV